LGQYLTQAALVITGISASQHRIPRTANGHGNHKEFEDLISGKVGKLHSLSNSRKSTGIIFNS
jgi:hypothetical protein